MEHADFIEQALNLTLFGMGFVFVFLTLLVLTVKTMSVFIQKISKTAAAQSDFAIENEVDEETKFVIEQAIKMHRGA